MQLNINKQRSRRRRIQYYHNNYHHHKLNFNLISFYLRASLTAQGQLKNIQKSIQIKKKTDSIKHSKYHRTCNLCLPNSIRQITSFQVTGESNCSASRNTSALPGTNYSDKAIVFPTGTFHNPTTVWQMLHIGNSQTLVTYSLHY